jgi:hypothetical protein
MSVLGGAGLLLTGAGAFALRKLLLTADPR